MVLELLEVVVALVQETLEGMVKESLRVTSAHYGDSREVSRWPR